MPYVAGPFIAQTDCNVHVEQTDYDLLKWMDSEMDWVDATLDKWDCSTADMAVLLDEPSDPWPDIDLKAAIDVLNVYCDPATLFGVSDMITALGIGDASLAAAIGFAPAEAWVNPSTPFVAPPPVEVLQIPKIDPKEINFSITGTVSSQPGVTAPPGTPGATSVALTNTTAFGNPNFTVGDKYVLSATGPVGAEVGITAVWDGNQLPYSDLGTIGSDGTWSLSGQMDPSSTGVWSETIYVAGTEAGTFAFVVVG